jgi:hypothetical protein
LNKEGKRGKTNHKEQEDFAMLRNGGKDEKK